MTSTDDRERTNGCWKRAHDLAKGRRRRLDSLQQPGTAQCCLPGYVEGSGADRGLLRERPDGEGRGRQGSRRTRLRLRRGHLRVRREASDTGTDRDVRHGLRRKLPQAGAARETDHRDDPRILHRRRNSIWRCGATCASPPPMQRLEFLRPGSGWAIPSRT